MEAESLNVSMIVFKMMLRVVFGLEIGMRMSIARYLSAFVCIDGALCWICPNQEI